MSKTKTETRTHFEIKKRPRAKCPEFENLRWCIKATDQSDYERRFRLDALYFDDGFCYGTDGHRLHFFETGEILAELKGFYRPVKNSAKEIILIPIDAPSLDYKKVIPKHENFLEIKGLGCVTKNPLAIGGCYARVIRAMDPETILQYNYFSEALSGEEWTAFYYCSETPLPVVFHCEARNRHVVIMPANVQ